MSSLLVRYLPRLRLKGLFLSLVRIINRLGNIFIGLVSMYMVHKLKFKYFSKLSVVTVLMSVVLLIVVFLIGSEINGAKR